MRSGGLLTVVVALGASASSALAVNLPPAPTLPVPTLPVPTLPTPTLPTPTVPVPLPPAPKPPHVPLPRPHVPTTTSPSSGARAAKGTRAPRKHSSTAHRAVKRHAVALGFRLRRATPIEVAVLQTFPACVSYGSFTVAGHAGSNRIRFNGKLHGRKLPLGTYRITATSRTVTVLERTVVVNAHGVRSVNGGIDRCGVAGMSVVRIHSVRGAGQARARRAPSARPTQIVRNADAPHASAAAPFSAARVSKNVTNPLVVFALALAVFLLGLAALPQRAVPDPRLTDVLARHRVEVALAGAAALAAGVLALVLS